MWFLKNQIKMWSVIFKMKKLPKTSRKIVIFLIIAASFLTLISGCSSKSSREVVARVNGEEISKDELYDVMVKSIGEDALNYLISQKIIDLEAKKQNIVVTNEDINKELEKVYAYYGGEEAFKQSLQMSGYSFEEYKKSLSMNIKTKKLLQPRISITEDEMKAYFEENKQDFAQEKQVKARHILVENEEKAKEIIAKLRNGDDFAELAKKYSIDPATKENGGDLGFFGKGDMVKEFEDVAFSLKVGEISSPVKTQYGYHIIKVEEKKEAQEADYEKSKDKIKDILFNQKVQQEYDPWMQELYKQYNVENLLNKK